MWWCVGATCGCRAGRAGAGWRGGRTEIEDALQQVHQRLQRGGLAQALGNLHEAARLLGAAAAIRREHHTHGLFERELFAMYDRRLPAVHSALDPADFARAWAEGHKLSIQKGHRDGTCPLKGRQHDAHHINLGILPQTSKNASKCP